MFNLLNLNKPAGMTSRDAVNRVQWLVRQLEGGAEGPARKRGSSKVGHAGTLDPIATGVLVVCLGPATRLIEHVQRMPKQYRGTFLLGRRSPSDDVELEPELLPGPPIPGWTEIEDATQPLLGEVEQTPPIYSAVKVQGQKAYDLARRGDAVDLAPKRVTIYAIAIAKYDYPELVLDITCGGGTYVRAIGRDLAQSLGTGAVMSGLARTAIGDFTIDDAVLPAELTVENFAEALLPPELAVADLQRVDLTAEQAAKLRGGGAIEPPEGLSPRELALFEPDGRLLGLGKRKRGGLLWPVRVFAGG